MTEIDYDARIQFHPDDQIMEVDFSKLTFDRSKPVNAYYDQLDSRIAATGQKWFFLVNYQDCKIQSEAWIAFAHRGKLLNIGYSIGSVRFAVSDETRDTIYEKSREENFDPNLFASRAAAVEHLRALRNAIPPEEFKELVRKKPDAPKRPMSDRIARLDEDNTIEVDLTGCSFASSADIDAMFDEVETAAAGDRKSYILLNMKDVEILPDAWYRWAIRSKRLADRHAHAILRYNQHKPELQSGAAGENLFDKRSDAVARIAQLRAKA